MEEEWKVIEDAPNYEVSNFGRVRKRKNNKILKITLFNKTPSVYLVKNGNHRTTQSVPRLVAKAFLPNPNNMSFVLIKDGDVSNLKVSNLYWSNGFSSEGVNAHKYIHKVKISGNIYYYVIILKLDIRKCFNDISKAIAYRDRILNENKDLFGGKK